MQLSLLLFLFVAFALAEQTILSSCHIVIFNKYMQATEHNEFISKILNTTQGFQIVDRNNPSLQYPTDFALVHFLKPELVQLVLKSPHVKYVIPNKRYGKTETTTALNIQQYNDSYVDNGWMCMQSFINYTLPVYTLLEHRGRLSTDWLTSSHWSENDHDLFTFPTANGRRQLCSGSPHEEVTDKLGAKYLWDKGFRGKGIKVAVFDTGLRQDHKAFTNVQERINYTNEKDEDDGLGHGTFVAGLVASNASDCRGFAPDSDLYIFKVFTSAQVSYTTWFLDAFNYALASGMNILNLSIGGPDYMDMPFVDKVRELSAHGIVLVSAIGNDGPLYGTLNNPADLECVLGVGGIDDQHHIASFSSRGVTTRELSNGYGRVKPDIVTYGHRVRGTGRFSGCAVLSGTSVASPVATGILTLLMSSVPEKQRQERMNIALIKQVMYESAQQLPVDVIDGTSTGFNIFEQGAGRIPSIDILHTNLNKLLEQPPVPSFYPQKLDLTDCPYMWPWCAQPIYYSAQPLVINVTVLNPISAWGKFCEQPIYEPETNGKAIELDLSDYTSIRPYSGHLGVRIKVSSKYRLWEGVASGRIIARICTPTSEPVSVELPVQVNVIRTPVRRKRILWSQYHNVQYPMGYIPRDNLNHKDNILDWNGDHPHTNFRTIFQHLIKSKYYVELLVGDLTSFDARMYGTLLLVDTEEEFTQEERNKLQDDVERLGLGLAVFGDWYNTDIMQEIRFFDDNTKTTWYPLTGGCNIPALNALLDPYHIAFGDHIYDGEITAILKKQDQEEQRSVIRATYGSGTSLVKFPQGGIMVRFPLKDQTKEMLKQANETPDVPVLGFVKHEKGRIAVFGDSNCLDDVNRPVYCTWLLDQMLRFTSFDAVPTNDRGIVYAKFEYVMNEDFVQPGVKLPERVPGRVVSPRVPLQNLIHARPLQNLTRYIGKGLKTEPYDSSGEVVADNSVVQLSLSPLRLLIPIGLMFIVPASVLYFIFRKRVHKFTRESRLRV